jgi:hypothetical protein
LQVWPRESYLLPIKLFDVGIIHLMYTGFIGIVPC